MIYLLVVIRVSRVGIKLSNFSKSVTFKEGAGGVGDGDVERLKTGRFTASGI